MSSQSSRGRLLLALQIVWAWPSTGQAQQVDAAGLAAYQEHCASCHGSDASTFMNRVLERKGDSLLVRRSGTPLQSFLGAHGAADSAERENLANLLRGIVRDDITR